jgi:chemotaxis protein MotA
MNTSSIIGLVLGIGVLYSALDATSSDFRFFLDYHGMLIVLGGTLAAASISFSLADVLRLTRVFMTWVLVKNEFNYQDVIQNILDINKKMNAGVTDTNDLLQGVHHDFLKEGVTLLAAGVLKDREVREVLEQRLKTLEIRYLNDANMFRVIGRFPPAFGLLATTLGMIGLLQKIGQPDSQKLIGPAMSVGLIGTLYGIALANLFFIPIAESLTEKATSEVTLRRMIIEGTLLLKSQVSNLVIREQLNSYLLPRERLQRKMAA